MREWTSLAQNIYDRPEFFDGYSRLDRSVRGLDGAPEWPAIVRLLPELHGSGSSILAAASAGSPDGP